jgi:hypothetical protein
MMNERGAIAGYALTRSKSMDEVEVLFHEVAHRSNPSIIYSGKPAKKLGVR